MNLRGWLQERKSALLLFVIVAAFVGIRAPVLWQEPGGMDEECYAVPGYFVARDGIPKLPHIPGRKPDSIFYHADSILFAEPPLYFYLQAIFFRFLPPTYGTARLATLASGVVLLVLMWAIVRRFTGSAAAGLWAAGLFSLSRWFFLQAIRARPDVLCTAFGLAAILTFLHWRESRRVRWLAVTGVLIGLGGLTHPFAIVYALQLGVWLLIETRGWDRLRLPALMVITSMAAFALWTPLILMQPDVFRIQLANQLFGSAQEHSLLMRLLLPWDSILYHHLDNWRSILPWQFLLAYGGLTACTIKSFLYKENTRPLTVMAWTAAYLMSAVPGIHHNVPGYWTYPAALMIMTTGICVQQGLGLLTRRSGRIAAAIVGGLLILSMVPQSRLGTLFVHLRHWRDVEYCAPLFAQRMMDALPKDALCVVDSEFALDFIAAGWRVHLSSINPKYAPADEVPYDYFIASRVAHDDPALMHAMSSKLKQTWGNRENRYACYAELYQRE